MLDRMPNTCQELPASVPCYPSVGEDKWKRSLKDDLKTCVELVCELKEKLDKLHPRCADIVAGWMRS
jgi:hypothetical protein